MNSPKCRILCTEDDIDTCDLIIAMLKAEGYEALCTDNSEEALKLSQNSEV
jgi:DNA-binding response OmpR family regulator